MIVVIILMQWEQYLDGYNNNNIDYYDCFWKWSKNAV